MELPFNVVIIFGVVVFFEKCLSPGASSSLVTKTSLTTAKVFDGNLIPKPTSYFGRSVEHVKQSSSTPYGLGVTGRARRAHTINSLRDIWNWDYWCQLQAKSGNCSAPGKYGVIKRYYYEAHWDSCTEFMYSGCDGNENNFKTLEECKRTCDAASRMTLKDTHRDIYCSLQPNVGTCLALVERYYYDVQTNECKTFIYGGCGGNQNRFDNFQRCEERCLNVTSNKK